MISNIVFLVGGENLFSLQILPLDLIEQICLTAVSDIIQNCLGSDRAMFVFEKSDQRGCGKNRARVGC